MATHQAIAATGQALRTLLYESCPRDEFPAAQFQSALLVTFKDLIARLARDTELPAQRSHRLAVLQPDHKPHSFVHHRTLLPWHLLSAPFGPKKCNPCLRNVLLPMSRNGHLCHSARMTSALFWMLPDHSLFPRFTPNKVSGESVLNPLRRHTTIAIVAIIVVPSFPAHDSPIGVLDAANAAEPKGRAHPANAPGEIAR